MKTSTLLMLGGAAAVAYYLATRKTADAVTTAVSALRATEPQQAPVIVNVDTDADDLYYPSSWAMPVWGARAWRGGGGRGRHHGGGGGGGRHHRGR